MLGADAMKEGGASDDWYRFLCVFSCSHSLPVPELCAKNGQCLCARQNFNKGVRRWWGEKRKKGGGGSTGELALAEEVCHTIDGRMKKSNPFKDANKFLVLLRPDFQIA